MSGHAQIGGGSVSGNSGFDGGDTVCCGYAGSHALSGFNGNGEGGLETAGVVCNHHRQA